QNPRGQLCPRRSLGPRGRLPANMLERVCEDGNEAAIVRRLTRQVGLSLGADKEDSLCRQRAAIRLNPILCRLDQSAGPQMNPFGPKISVRHFQYDAANVLVGEEVIASELLVVQ